MITLVCIFFQTILFYVCYRRAGFLPAPTLYVGYLLGCQVVLYLLKIGVVESEFAMTWTTFSYIKQYDRIALAFALLSAFYTSSLIGLKRISSSATIRDIERVRISSEIIWAITFVLLARQIIDLFVYDWSVIWRNGLYLSMTDPDYLRSSSGLIRVANQLATPSAVVAAFISVYSLARRHYAAGAILLILFTWHVFFFLAAHSRAATLILAASALAVFVFTRHRNIAIFVAGLALFSLVSALAGRSSGHHGLSSIAEIMGNIASRDQNVVDIVQFTILNFFEGVFTFSEHFARSVYFAPEYKNLSLSPLPSFIDGFANIREANESKLFIVVPRGALDEILQFGFVHSVVYFSTQFFAIRLSLISSRRTSSVAALTANFLLFANLFIQMAYPVRTIFRVYLVVIAVAVWLIVVQRKTRTRQPGMERVLPRVPAGSPTLETLR